MSNITNYAGLIRGTLPTSNVVAKIFFVCETLLRYVGKVLFVPPPLQNSGSTPGTNLEGLDVDLNLKYNKRLICPWNLYIRA